MASWVLKLAFGYFVCWMARNQKILPVLAYIIHFHNKIHFTIYRLFLADGIILCLRCLFHTNLLGDGGLTVD